jgi:hypothetical protein
MIASSSVSKNKNNSANRVEDGRLLPGSPR